MIFLVSLFIGICVHKLFLPAVVFGSSMEPSFHQGEVLKCTKEIGNLEYGDVVIYKTGIYQVIKRVVGLPGDTLSVENGFLYVNGEMSPYNYSVIESENLGLLSSPYVVTEGCCFCMGDNRNESVDSRVYGEIEIEKIKYRVTGVFFPGSKSGRFL